MKEESDIAYFSRRAEEERERAEHAIVPATYRIHTEFARQYERRLRMLIATSSGHEAANGEATY